MTIDDRTTPGQRPTSLPAKVREAGAGCLSDHDLIALLTGAKQPAGLLRDGLLALATNRHLVRPLLTSAQAVRLEAAVEFAHRLMLAQRPVRPSCSTPEEAVQILLPDLLLLNHEELLCIPLDPQERMIGRPLQVSRGDVDGTDASARAFYRLALSVGATSAICAHNHPSGQEAPSCADAAVTRRLAAAGRTVDIPLVDHIIVCDSAHWCSLRRTQPSLFS